VEVPAEPAELAAVAEEAEAREAPGHQADPSCSRRPLPQPRVREHRGRYRECISSGRSRLARVGCAVFWVWRCRVLTACQRIPHVPRVGHFGFVAPLRIAHR
jgi:hypothetical protein